MHGGNRWRLSQSICLSREAVTSPFVRRYLDGQSKTIRHYSADIIDVKRILNNLADTIIYHEEVVACIK